MTIFLTTAEFLAACKPESATPEWILTNNIQTNQRKLKELKSDLDDLIESGDITHAQAYEIYSRKSEQWANGMN